MFQLLRKCMPKRLPDNIHLQFKLLQESLWNLEDKINVILESTADHEAELIRLKRHGSLMHERLGKVETQLNGQINKLRSNERT